MRKVLTFTMSSPNGFINKVTAIKGLRKLTGMDLKSSKEFVELVQERGVLNKVITVTDQQEHESEGIITMRGGGIIVTDTNTNARADILDALKEIAAEAVKADQYDIAKQLIAVIEVSR